MLEQHIEEAIAKLKSEFNLLESAQIELRGEGPCYGFVATTDSGSFYYSFWPSLGNCTIILFFKVAEYASYIQSTESTLDEAIATFKQTINQRRAILAPWEG